ncbi:MAG: PKD domain-containing protein [Bacteroidia bacterium]
MNKIVIIFLLIFAGCVLDGHAYTNRLTSEKSKGWAQKPFQRKAFIENKGQFNNVLPADKQNFDFVFDNGTRVFFYKNELLFQFSKPLLTKQEMETEEDDEEKEREREAKLNKREIQFISMKWLNANENVQLEVEEEQSVDYGYVIVPENKKGYTAHCKGYSKLKIKNLYNGVDVEYFFNENDGYKYNLYVSPNADLTQIQQLYEGANSVNLVNGNIVVKTIQGDIIDHAPLSFLTNDNTQKVESSYRLKNNCITFNIQKETSTAITIDPWVTVPTMPNSPGDNGVDQYGNTYVTNGHYILEKYSPTGVLLMSTDVMGGVPGYYGDMLSDSRGYCFFNTMGSHSRGHATGVDSVGNFLWDSFGITECWRFVLNECTNQVLSLTGYRHSATGFAKIDTETGALNGYTQSGSCCQDPHSGVIDYNGDVYSVASTLGGGTQIYKFTPLNTIAAVYPAVGSWGYGSGYVSNLPYTQGYNGMTILGKNLYMFDGATLFKVNKANGAIVNQVTVPGGVNKKNGGIYITSCGNVFVGSGTGVYMYDINFNQLDFKATTGKVFDLAFNAFNQTISACGPGHVTELAFTIPPCVFSNQPSIIPSYDSLPNGSIVLNLTGGVPDYTYNWYFNGAPFAQTTDSIGGLLPGIYKCVYTDSQCPIPNVDSVELLVFSVSIEPNFGFQNQCLHTAIQFSDSSTITPSDTIVSWLWKFGDGDTSNIQNPSHMYATAGTYNVTLVLTSTYGFKDSVIKVVTVYPKPEADYTHVNKCNGTGVPFTDISTIAAPEVINSWQWNFGDNSTGSGNTTTHLYATPGFYNTTLIVGTSNGCLDTVTYQVKVFNNPVASFTSANVCKGADSVNFTNTSIVASPDSISTYLWNFGDGSNVSTADAVHKYSTHGAYNVILITTTSNNCTDAAATTVSVFDAPSTNFTFTDVCLFDTAVFNNTSANPTMGTIASVTWDLGDGSPLINNSSTPHHRYNAIGNYQITLITRSSNLACADTLTDSISVYPMPIADFSSVDVCLNEPMYFSDSSQIVAGTIDAWSWNFGDATPLNTTQDPNHVYASYNTYTVTQIVTSNYGCKDTVSKTVVVHPLPTAQFSLLNVCDGTAMPFTDMSSIPSTDVIQSWQWDFGDNTLFDTTQNTSHLYSTPGPYPIELLVVSQFGCKDSITLPGIVNPNPVVDFIGSDTVGCEPLCVNYQNLSTIAAGNNSSFVWNFGPAGSSSNLQNPAYCYGNDSIFAPINYDVTLTVTSNAGCVTTLTKSDYITVYPLPVASFSTAPTSASIINPIIEFSDASTGVNYWSWTFGEHDTVSSISNPPPYTYSDTGGYQITLITSTQYNCTDTAYQTIYIEPSFLFYIPSAFSPNGDGDNDTFTGKGIFVKEYEMMIFNRWGELIFYTDDLNKPWDGTINYGSIVAQQDVYVYTVKIMDYMKKKHEYHGTVTLVR